MSQFHQEDKLAGFGIHTGLTSMQVVFMGGNFCDKLDKAPRIKFCGFNFHEMIAVILTLILEHVQSMECFVVCEKLPCP